MKSACRSIDSRRPVGGEHLALERLDLALEASARAAASLARRGRERAAEVRRPRAAARADPEVVEAVLRHGVPAVLEARVVEDPRLRQGGLAERAHGGGADAGEGAAASAGRSRSRSTPPMRSHSASKPVMSPDLRRRRRLHVGGGRRARPGAARRRWSASRRRPSARADCARAIRGSAPSFTCFQASSVDAFVRRNACPAVRSRRPGGPAPAPSARARRERAGRPRGPRGPAARPSHDAADESGGAEGSVEFPAGGGAHPRAWIASRPFAEEPGLF